MTWNRCDVCGRFIGMKEFEQGAAIRNLVTPDSWYSDEEYETYHMVCAQTDLEKPNA